MLDVDMTEAVIYIIPPGWNVSHGIKSEVSLKTFVPIRKQQDHVK